MFIRVIQVTRAICERDETGCWDYKNFKAMNYVLLGLFERVMRMIRL